MRLAEVLGPWLWTKPDLTDEQLATLVDALAAGSASRRQDLVSRSLTEVVYMAALRHPNAGSATTTAVASCSGEDAGRIAVRQLRDADALMRVSEAARTPILAELARHPHTPSDVAAGLLTHRAAQVRYAAALHPGVPAADTLEVLAAVPPKKVFGADPVVLPGAIAVAFATHPELVGPWAQAAIERGGMVTLRAAAEDVNSYEDEQARDAIHTVRARKSIAAAIQANPFWPRENWRPWRDVDDLDARTATSSDDPAMWTRVLKWDSTTLTRMLLTRPGPVPPELADLVLARPRGHAWDLTATAAAYASEPVYGQWWQSTPLKHTQAIRDTGAKLGPVWHLSPRNRPVNVRPGIWPNPITPALAEIMSGAVERVSGVIAEIPDCLTLSLPAFAFLTDTQAAGTVWDRTRLQRLRGADDAGLRDRKLLELVCAGEAPLDWAVAFADSQTPAPGD